MSMGICDINFKVSKVWERNRMKRNIMEPSPIVGIAAGVISGFNDDITHQIRTSMSCITKRAYD